MLLRHPIRWRDTDALGHVNNAVYVTYVEELLVHALGPILGDDYVTARIELDFRSELTHADRELVMEASLERVGTSSVAFGVRIGTADGRVAAEGRTVVVAWDPEARRSRPLTEAEQAQLSSFEARDA